MKFSVALLKIEDEEFTVDTFSSMQSRYDEGQKETEASQQSKIIEREIREDQFISFYIEEGKALPRTEYVYNTETKRDEENPRTHKQIERKKQTFVLIHVAKQKIFISNFSKKKAFQKWLKGQIHKEVIIKNIVDREEFVKTIKSVRKIHFSATQDFFLREGILGKVLTRDIHNYGTALENVSVKFVFQEEHGIHRKLKSALNTFLKQEKEHEIEKLEVSGRFDDKFERVFNAEEIIDKVDINVEAEEDGLFDKSKVFVALIREVR